MQINDNDDSDAADVDAAMFLHHDTTVNIDTSSSSVIAQLASEQLLAHTHLHNHDGMYHTYIQPPR